MSDSVIRAARTIEVPEGFKAVLVSDQLVERMAAWSEPAAMSWRIVPVSESVVELESRYAETLAGWVRREPRA
jgi:hypothetical protein